MAVAATVTLAVTLVVACSSSKKSSTSGSTTGSTAGATGGSTGGSAPGVTATEIHVGALEYKAFYADAEIGARARIARENAAGGVFGRKIVLDNVVDDNQDTNQDLSAAKTLVEQDHEFALVPVMTANLAAASYLAQQKVPFFGWSIEPRWCNNQYGFGWGGADCDPATQPMTGDFVQAEQKLFSDGTANGKKIALIAEDNNSARVALNSFAAIWKTHGATVVLQDTSMPTPPAVVSDFTPYAEKIISSGADLLETVNSVSDTLGLYQKLQALGFKGVVQDFTLYDSRVAAPTKGLVTEVQLNPFEAASSNPAVAQMVHDITTFKPGTVPNQVSAAGYLSMDLFIAILKAAGSNLTRDSFLNAANGGSFTYDYQGAVGPVSYPKDHSQGSSCLSYVQSTGTAYAIKVPFTCVGLIPNPVYKKP